MSRACNFDEPDRNKELEQLLDEAHEVLSDAWEMDFNPYPSAVARRMNILANKISDWKLKNLPPGTRLMA